LKGAVSTDDFYPLPEYVASLIPPAGEPVSFEDEKEEASFFAGPQEGSSSPPSKLGSDNFSGSS
jgi:hypothetical protein